MIFRVMSRCNSRIGHVRSLNNARLDATEMRKTRQCSECSLNAIVSPVACLPSHYAHKTTAAATCISCITSTPPQPGPPKSCSSSNCHIQKRMIRPDLPSVFIPLRPERTLCVARVLPRSATQWHTPGQIHQQRAIHLSRRTYGKPVAECSPSTASLRAR